MQKIIRIILSLTLVLFSIDNEVSAAENSMPDSQRTIIGKIMDSNGIPVVGAIVIYNGNGTISGIDGDFSVSADTGEVTLEVSCLGYVTQTVKVPSSQDNITITLADDTFSLEETVVVGYGVQKKVNLTGAVSVVNSKELSNRTATSLSHMLQGQVPGLTITTSSGNPINSAGINIRGTNSINGGSPLVLIDGVDGDMSRLNPNDVESISVIKDASSSAVYGARASFGVILITTKSGSKSDGKPIVRYSGRAGWSNPTTSTDFETRGYDYVYTHDYFTRQWNPSSAFTQYTEEDMHELYIRRNDKVEHPDRPWVTIQSRDGRDQYVYYGNYDWYHMMFSDLAVQTQHNISISGGAENYKYFVSGGYQFSGGTFTATPDSFHKYNIRANMEVKLAKWARLSNNMSYFKNNYTYPGSTGVDNVFNLMSLSYLPTFPAKNPDGTMVYTNPIKNLPLYHIPILGETATNNIQYNQFSNKAELTLTPVKGLEVKGNFTYTYMGRYSTTRTKNAIYSPFPNELASYDTGSFLDQLSETAIRTDFISANVYATYGLNIKEDHHLKVMAGWNYETYYYKNLNVSGQDLISDTLFDMSLVGSDEEGQKKLSATGGQNESALMGVFGRFNYDYKDKYLLEVSARYDGTSRFPSKHRWGFFPSASLGWKISEEGFFSPVKDRFNLLKLRFSYGSLGNQQVGYYDYIRKISLSTMDYYLTADATTKPQTAGIGAPVAGDLTWERAIHYNLGLDMAFLDNRLSFTGEAYIRDTKDMLCPGAALPSVYGAPAPEANAADLRTKGYELCLTWKDAFMLAGKPFSYGVTATFNDYVSEITRYDNPTKTFARKYYEGYRFGEIWGFVTDGLFASDDEAANYHVDQDYLSAHLTGGWKAGDVKFVDLDGDNILGIGSNTVDDPGDRKIIGNSEPRFLYGLTLNASWYGFDLSVFFQGVGRQNWYPPGDAGIFWGTYSRPYQSFLPKDFMDMCWTEENPNPDAYFPRARGYVSTKSDRELGAVNDRYLQNIGYCRLKNLTLGYTLPEKWTKKITIDSIRLYFTGENLWYFSPLKKVNRYIDPEEAAVGHERVLQYRWQKSFMFGIDITF